MNCIFTPLWSHWQTWIYLNLKILHVVFLLLHVVFFRQFFFLCKSLQGLFVNQASHFKEKANKHFHWNPKLQSVSPSLLSTTYPFNKQFSFDSQSKSVKPFAMGRSHTLPWEGVSYLSASALSTNLWPHPVSSNNLKNNQFQIEERLVSTLLPPLCKC